MRERKTNRRKLTITGPLDWKEPTHSSYVWGLRSRFVRTALALEPELENATREFERLSRDDPSEDAVRDEACRRMLKTWAKYNLKDEWCRVWVPSKLRAIRSIVAGEVIERPAGLPQVEPPPLPDLTWDPTECTAEVMVRRYREYLAAVKDTYHRAGYKRTPERREAAHVWWLAGYQVCGWSERAIAKALDIDRAAVLRAIKKLAVEIDLTLRAPTRNDRSWTPEKIRKALPPVTQPHSVSHM
jgi:hypothetical protein